MEKFVEQTLLYDFYGELLTEHQKAIYEEYVLDNYSISEIAKEHDISRQGVHDQLKRTDKILEEYENTLHLVEKFLKVKDKVSEINNLSNSILNTEDTVLIKDKIADIRNISNEIIDFL